MRDPDKPPFISLVEVVERLAGSNFAGQRKDVDQKEALDDVLAALRGGAIRARGINWETNETGRRWPANKSGGAQRITTGQWCVFEYVADENRLYGEFRDPPGDTYQATWFEKIEVDRDAAEILWPGRIDNKGTNRALKKSR